MSQRAMTRLERLQKRKAMLREDPQRENRSGAWGHEPGFRWVTRERMDELCTRHRRRVCVRIWHGRRIRYVLDTKCRMRAMISRSRRGPAKRAVADVVLQ